VNLRCSYCMSPALLTDGEMARLIAIALQRLGITEVRFTGGEPLLRRGLADLMALGLASAVSLGRIVFAARTLPRLAIC
jgi:molybdenum cofactor biosynthesis enzyme MoaA